MAQFQLFLFGSPRLARNGRDAGIGLRKALALLIYLAVTRQPHSRDALATLFWPESGQRSARASLRRTLYQINQALDADLLAVSPDVVAIVDEADLWLDVASFRQSLDECLPAAPVTELPNTDLARLEEAVALYSGDFLVDFSLPDCAEFDEWQFFQREELRQMAVKALEQLVLVYQTRADFKRAIGHARHWLTLDPLHEPAHRHLMRLYAWSGQQAAALRQYEECERILAQELGIRPGEKTVQLHQEIQARRFPVAPQPQEPGGVGRGDPEQMPVVHALGAPPAPTANLPTDPTPFVGRQAELAQLQNLLSNPDCRLISIVGLGGMGKTRLALEAVHQFVQNAPEQFADGVLFVPLAGVEPESVDGDNGVLFALADALHLPLSDPSAPRQQLLAFLRKRNMLFLLDSAEHLLHDEGTQTGATLVELITAILHAAPGIKILVTSREPLRVQLEWRLDLESLTYPEVDASEQVGERIDDLERLRAYTSVQLFLQIAEQVRPDFVLTETNARHVRRLCHLLSGIPLALKLAGAWVRLLSCERIADQIERNFDLLATQMRDAPPRQRSMRAVFDSTWHLLDTGERRALQTLSVFRGGFGEKAAAQVASVSPDLLVRLLDRGLLQVEATPQGVRYRLHELVRQYAAEKLQSTPGAHADVQARHGAYYASFLQAQANELRGERAQSALQSIGVELENVRAGWRWLLTQLRNGDQWRTFLDHYLTALFHFHDTRSSFQEGEALFAHAAAQIRMALAEGSDADTVSVALGQILGRQGWFAFHLGRHGEAQHLLQQSLEILCAHDARSEMIFSLNYLGAVHRHLGEYQQAERLLQEAILLCRQLGDDFGLSVALNVLGQIAYLQGEYEQAERLCTESLSIKRKIGDRWGTSFSLNYLGAVAQAQGKYAEAQQLFEESRAICEELGDRRGVANAHFHLGDVFVSLGQYEEAQQAYETGLSIFSEINNVLGMVTAHHKLGDCARERGDAAGAWRQYQQALRTADRNVPPQVLDTLTSIAALWSDRGDVGRAVAVLESIRTHPVSSAHNRQRASSLLVEFTQQPSEPALLARAEADTRVKHLIDEILLDPMPEMS